MHKRLVFNIISRNLLIVCLFMLIPLGWAVAEDLYSVEVSAFVATLAFGIFIATAARLGSRVKKEDFNNLNIKDGLAIVGLSWIGLSAFGALPLFLTGVVPTYMDAFFEITSGFTTTGATVIPNVEILPPGILFWRSLTHWLGGMGIIVLYLALLPALGHNAFQLFKAESPGLTAERILPRIRETAQVLWKVYFFLSFLETGLLMAGGMTLFDALCHTFGTMATGGFSTRNASLAAFSPFVQWVVVVFMFLAGTNFMLHYLALKGNLRAYFQSEEFRWYFFLIVFLVPVFALALVRAAAPESPLRLAVFQVVSILTTTGFTTTDFNAWPPFLTFVLVLLMFIGGCGGSTGGGLKVVRIILNIKIAIRSVVQAVLPNAVLRVRFNNAALSSPLVLGAVSYFVIFVGLFFLGTTLMTLTEGCDLVTAMAASIATLSNIGPGLGAVGAAQNYAWISLPGKGVLIFLMLAGRLELYSILILLLPATWKK